MNLGLRFNLIAMLTVFFGLLTFCLADDRPELALICTGVCAAGYAAGTAGRGWKPLCLPRVLVNLLVLGAIVNAAFHASHASVGQPIVSHLGEFLVYVQLLKLFDRRTSRDESQLLTLSVFVVIAAMLTSNTLPVGLCLLIYTPLAISACMLYQLRAGQRRALSESTAPVPDAPSQSDPVVFHGRRAAAQFRGVATSSLIGAAALAAVVFALTPRGLGAGSLGRFGEARITQIGFTDQITLGNAGFLQDNPTPVLDLAIEDSTGANLGAPDHPYYLRGVTRDQYQKDPKEPPIWTRGRNRFGPDRQAQLDTGVEFSLESGADSESARAAAIIQRITLRTPASVNPVLFTVWRPQVITSAEPMTLVVDPDDFAIRRNGSAASELRYVVRSSQTDSGNDLEPDPPRGFATGAIRDLAVAIMGKAHIAVDPDERDRPANRQAAAAIRDYLQANFAYSKSLIKPAEGQDPIEMFLFDTKQGHCEYFASAMAAICQSIGLPARVVVGYVAADFNTITQKYLVRQSDAHAWVEIHVGGGAWQPFDPTPAGGVTALQRQSHGWMAAIRNWYDTLEFGWNRSVIGFNASTQKSSAVGRRLDFERVSRFFDDLSGRLFVSAKKLRAGEHPSFGIAWLFPSVLALCVIGLLVHLHRKKSAQRRSQPRTRLRSASRSRPTVETGFYRSALKALSRAGIGKPESLPPLAHAARLAQRDHPASVPFAALVSAYYRFRFGNQPLSPQENAAADRELAELKSLLNTRPSRTR
jgi:transglutaminase-like putative cysteine protease